MNKSKSLYAFFNLSVAWLMFSGCSGSLPSPEGGDPHNADRWLIVDCLLPAQADKLDVQMNYQAARRPIKTSGAECETRGGEYVSYDRANYKTALNVWLPRARAGEAEAQNYIGRIYEKGLLLPPDYETAAHWYSLAAEQGYSRAQINLGYLYEKGLGVTRNAAVALNWYRKASGIEIHSPHFASAIEVANASREGLDRLRRHLQQEQLKAEEYRQSLVRVQRQLRDYQQRIELLVSRKRAKALELELMKTRQPRKKQGIAALEQQLKRFQFSLADKQRQLTQAERQHRLLSDKVENVELNIASAAQWEGLLSIESIEPTTSVTGDVRSVKMDRARDKPRSADLGALKFGDYYALIIGNSDYQALPDLKTAVNDVRRADALLRNRYGFKTRLLLNATGNDMLQALNEFRKKLTPDDSFLLYYAGHGELDRINNRSYWQPVDADPVLKANWISNVAISEIVDAMAANHIMVVADSCYSGTLSLTTLARSGTGEDAGAPLEWVLAMEAVRARTVMTSGGIKPELNIGGGEHSVFAEAFHGALDSNQGLIEGQRLYREVLRRMRVSTARIHHRRIPEYSPIRHAGHEGGEFFFMPRRSVAGAAESTAGNQGVIYPTVH